MFSTRQYFTCLLCCFVLLVSCTADQSIRNSEFQPGPATLYDESLTYLDFMPDSSQYVFSRADYREGLYGFWLAQCIANWTGLVTEMDKIGGEGKDGKCAGFYTREDWGQADQPNLWNSNNYLDTIGFYFVEEGGVWGADDDTDIEYIYQHLLHSRQSCILTAEEIRDGWLKHIKATEENYLWVSNQQAFDLMREGILPPETSNPSRNPHYEMIDAQLTTEIFGLFAPGRPDLALQMAHLPIRTTAQNEAAKIAEFYVIMHSLAAVADSTKSMKENLFEMAASARRHLSEGSYAAAMYDFVKAKYEAGVPWEEARDGLHQAFQVEQQAGYRWATEDKACNGCFAAGINFGASIVSLFYGEGDLLETIKIGALAGWDSDNPTATWGGLLGFMLGREGVENAFGRKFANRFNIHRTRIGFDNEGIDDFDRMSKIGVFIIDRMSQELGGGGVDLAGDRWLIARQP